VMITNMDGSKYHVMHNFLGQKEKKFNNVAEMFRVCEYCWSEKKSSKGDGMWGYTNWAMNNIEKVSDQCINGRIAVCKQTRVGHTGGGGLIGHACNGGGNRNVNLWKQAGPTGGPEGPVGMTYNCLDTGMEGVQLPVDWDDNYHMFVRYA
jgi:hypothetical protein